MFVLVAVALISKNYLSDRKDKAEAECQQIGQEHFVEAKDNKMQPDFINAKLCDELTIINKDDKTRRIAFGEHEKHIEYDGISEKIIKKDESFTITLNKSGSYIFHDHFQEEVKAQFTVN